jgi:hypothetical protein
MYVSVLKKRMWTKFLQHYTVNGGEKIAWSMNSSRAYYDSQNLVFVEANKFEEMLKRNNLKPRRNQKPALL